MQVLEAPQAYDPKSDDITLFLAGGISQCEDWQSEVIKTLQTIESTTMPALKNLVIFNPRRSTFDINNKNETVKQIHWEFDRLEHVDLFTMFFANSPSPQPICFYELGRNIVRMQQRFPDEFDTRIFIGVQDGFSRKDDVLIQSDLASPRSLIRITAHTATEYANSLAIFYRFFIRSKYGDTYFQYLNQR